MLTKLQRNEIFQALGKGALEPADCVLDTVADDAVSPNAMHPRLLGRRVELPEDGSPWDRVRHIPTRCAYLFRIDGSRFSWAFSRLWTRGQLDEIPYRDQPAAIVPIDDHLVSESAMSWEEVVSEIEAWARSVPIWTAAAADYDEIPDLWAAMSPGELPAAAEDATDNTPFTAAERAQIATRIGEVKRQARENPGLTAGQVAGIEQKLDDLVEASQRVGRKDWRVILYGMAFGMIVNDLVPPHVVQGIITTVISGLGHILGLGGLPPSVSA